MIRIIKKVYSLFTLRQRQYLIILALMMLIGGVLESLSVSIVMPLISAIMDDSGWNDHMYTRIICGMFNIEDQRSYIIILIVLLILAFIIKNVYLLLEYYAQYTFIAKGRLKMQTDLLQKYFAKPYSFFLNVNSGEIVRIMSGDSNDVFILLTNLLTIFTEGCICIILGITIFVISPIIAIVLFLTLLIEIITIALIVKPYLKKIGDRRRKESGIANKWMLQSINGIKSIKVANSERFFFSNFKSHTEYTVDAERKNQTLGVLPRLLIETATIVTVLGMMLIGISTGKDIANLIPQLSAFVVAALKLLPGVNRISISINALPFYEGGLDSTLAVLNDDDILNEKIHKKENEILSNKEMLLSNCLEVKKLTFSYSNSYRNILEDAEVTIESGQSVGIVGASGAGKTTLIDIILGLLIPDKGGVYVDNINIKDNLELWRSHIAYIPQQIFLIDDTIRSNVIFHESNLSDDKKVWRALKEAKMDEFVRSLPEGLDTAVGEQGVRLSGGQRQRIGIARALFNDPKVVFFDEATSALDSETEAAIMDSINHLKGKKTLVIIAHRTSTLENCDVIYKIENGKIIRKC